MIIFKSRNILSFFKVLENELTMSGLFHSSLTSENNSITIDGKVYQYTDIKYVITNKLECKQYGSLLEGIEIEVIE